MAPSPERRSAHIRTNRDHSMSRQSEYCLQKPEFAWAANAHYRRDGRQTRGRYDAELGVRCVVSDPPDAVHGTSRVGVLPGRRSGPLLCTHSP